MSLIRYRANLILTILLLQHKRPLVIASSDPALHFAQFSKDSLKALKEVRMLNAHIHEILKVFDI